MILSLSSSSSLRQPAFSTISCGSAATVNKKADYHRIRCRAKRLYLQTEEEEQSTLHWIICLAYAIESVSLKNITNVEYAKQQTAYGNPL